MAGHAAHVIDLDTSHLRVGRFGWKGVRPTLFQFNGDAFLNELGITSPQFPDENCPQVDCGALAHNPRPDMNDPGGAAVLAVTGFIQVLGPPPRASGGSSDGESVFTAIDDVGALGDGVDEGDARGPQMRTAPLWGLAKQTRLLHDGRVVTVSDAILAHDGQARVARDRFANLDGSARDALLAFLSSL